MMCHPDRGEADRRDLLFGWVGIMLRHRDDAAKSGDRTLAYVLEIRVRWK
jgi:hypothetical protein